MEHRRSGLGLGFVLGVISAAILAVGAVVAYHEYDRREVERVNDAVNALDAQARQRLAALDAWERKAKQMSESQAALTELVFMSRGEQQAEAKAKLAALRQQINEHWQAKPQ